MSCCICLSKVKYNSYIIRCIQCKQIFHKKCFMKWYVYNDKMNQCPHCNYISIDKINISQYIPNDNDTCESSFSSSYTSSSDNDIEQNNIDYTISNQPYYNIDTLYQNRITYRYMIQFVLICIVIICFCSIISLLLYKYNIFNFS